MYQVTFPEGGYAWDLDYRGQLSFLEQARKQPASRRLHVEDGWTLFVQGWLRVIAKVFNIEIPCTGRVFQELSDLARQSG